MLNYYTGVLKNYAGFQGRARRAEFWQFFLVNFVISILLNIIGAAIHFSFLGYIYALAVLVPMLAVAARRLHDSNRSGWWLLLYFTFVGIIVLIVFWCLEGTRGDNKHGADPKNPGVDAATAYTTL